MHVFDLSRKGHQAKSGGSVPGTPSEVSRTGLPTADPAAHFAPVCTAVKMETAHHGINLSLVEWQRQLSFSQPLWFIWNCVPPWEDHRWHLWDRFPYGKNMSLVTYELQIGFTACLAIIGTSAMAPQSVCRKTSVTAQWFTHAPLHRWVRTSHSSVVPWCVGLGF